MVHLGKSRRQLFEELDRPALRPLPEKPYQFAIWKTARVNIDYHVAFEKHFYSVPHTLIHQQVEIKATERMVEIFHKGKQVALHPRSSASAVSRPVPNICPPTTALSWNWMRIGCSSRPELLAPAPPNTCRPC